MRIIKILLIIFTVSIFLSCDRKTLNLRDVESQKSIYDELVRSDDLDCDKENIQVIVFLTELAKFRSSDKDFQAKESLKIRRLVEKFQDKDDLFDLANILKTLERNSTTDECLQNNLRNVYDNAFWDCIEILAQDRSEENMEKMKRLKEKMGIDGGDGYNWSTIVDRIPAP